MRRGRPAAVAAAAEQVADVGQERRLADAAGDQADVFAPVQVREAVAQRPPHLHALAGRHVGQQPRHLADDEIDHVHADGLAGLVEDGVVQREGPAEERVGAAGQAEHEELAGTDEAGQFGAMQTDAIGVAGQADVFDHGRRGLDEGRHVGLHLPAAPARSADFCCRRAQLRSARNGRDLPLASRPRMHRADGGAPQAHDLVLEPGQHAADLAVLALAEHDLQPGALALRSSAA